VFFYKIESSPNQGIEPQMSLASGSATASTTADKLKSAMTDVFTPILAQNTTKLVVSAQEYHIVQLEQLNHIITQLDPMQDLLKTMNDLLKTMKNLSDRVDALDKRTAMIITKLEEMRGGREVRGEHEPLVQRNAFSRPGADLPLNFTCD
jgi:hypothetical protein